MATATTKRQKAEAWRSRNASAVDRAQRELVAVVKEVVWYDSDQGFGIVRLHTGLAAKGPFAAGELELGRIPYRFLGRWEDHYKHGLQFSWDTFVLAEPHSCDGITKWLRDNARHVGIAKADALWAKYGSEAVDVLRLHPERVATDGLLPLDQAEEAAADLQRVAGLQDTKIDLFSLFSGRGFPRTLVDACIREWGARAQHMVRRNPWLLLVRELPGAGFKRCDRLYLDLGGAPARLKRQMLCAWNYLRSDTTGHTWFPYNEALRAVRSAVGDGRARGDEAVRLGVRAGWLATRTDGAGKVWVSEAEKAGNELTVASRVKWLASFSNVLWPTQNELMDSSLSAHQLARVAVALRSPISILAGTPGTGKTYTAAAVLRAVRQARGRDCIAVAAPTGKAAVRITAAMQRYKLDLTATTIHRLLGITRSGRDGRGWGFEFNEKRPLPYQFIVIDEVSMLDADLAASLFSALDLSAHVLLVGDPYQLPPVGHGAPLRDLIAAGVPCGELTEIQRNAGMIVEACVAIKSGARFETCSMWEPDATPPRNLKHIEAATADAQIDALRTVLRAFAASHKFDPIWDVQVLTALNEKSPISRVPLNAMLQGLLNPARDQTEEERTHANATFRIGDKAICLKNCFLGAVRLNTADGEVRRTDWAESYETRRDGACQVVQVFVANGDVGRVIATDPKSVVVEFATPARLVRIPVGKPKAGDDEDAGLGEMAGGAADFGLAYALTVHKSQGSEWPVVIVILDDAAGFVACREHHYTAISRATQLTILIGKRGTVDRQCKRVSLSVRKTFLRELLSE